MAARVEATQVKELIVTSKDDAVIDTNFIETAHHLVDTHLSGKGLSEGTLTQIELYLAAHFLAIAEEQGAIMRDAYGDASTLWADVYGKGLHMTRFGQQAMLFDTSGTLAKLNTGKLRAEFRVI